MWGFGVFSFLAWVSVYFSAATQLVFVNFLSFVDYIIRLFWAIVVGSPRHLDGL